MTPQWLRPHDVEGMDYSSFVGFVRERNRPSGGIRTVQEMAVQCRFSPATRVLEIGSNTGFTSVNLALLTGAETVVSRVVDIRPGGERLTMSPRFGAMSPRFIPCPAM